MSDLAVSPGTQTPHKPGERMRYVNGERDHGRDTRSADQSPAVSKADKVATGRSLPQRKFGKGVCGKGRQCFLSRTEIPFKTPLCDSGAHRPLSTQLPSWLLPASPPTEGGSPAWRSLYPPAQHNVRRFLDGRTTWPRRLAGSILLIWLVRHMLVID